MRDVPNGTLTELLDTLDGDALRRGKQFEKIVKWWLQNDPARSRNIKTVWLWDEWEDRPGRDIGVDLVAELLDGTLCAIQAKCYDAERDIPKSEIDSFISAASPRTFAQRWLVATTNGLSANARRTIHDNHVTFVPLTELDAAAVTWPSNPDSLRAARKPGKAKPRPHQQRAIRDVLNGLETNSRGQLIMACGTGKTLTALWITERLEANTTLVLVPSLNLLSQTLTEWAHNTQRDWTYICVCSDDTVNKEDDQPINTTVDLPYPVTTKPSEIAHFLKSKGRKIVFSTYQSSAQVAKAQKLSGKKFDLTICDEAHRLTGKTEADYATVLDEKKIISKKRLFMTATPRTYTANAKAKAEERGVEITSMDDPHIYGPQLHRLTFGEAIKQELLTDYQVVIVGVTDPQVQELIDRRELVSVNDTVTTDARTLAAHIGLAKATKDFNLARTISFHSRIKTAAQFAEDHPKILEWLPATHKPQGTTWTDTISGDMNTGQRRTLLQQLRKDQPGRHALLTNARCLTEGVDVPSLDGVAFIDPRSSQVDIIQAVGRAIRRSTSKTVGTIVLPVLIPEHVDPDEAMSDSAFKPIWSILNALKSHDQELSDSLDKLRTELGRRGSAGDVPGKIVQDLPTDIDELIPNFTAKLRLSIIDKTTSSWDHFYGLLLRYVEEFGHASPPKPKKSKDQLAGWVVGQRQRYRKRQLTQEEISKLESLPGWKWAVLEENWDEFFDLLHQFAQEYGHAVVPQGSASRPFRGRNLAGWVNNQRTKYGMGELSADEISKLESVAGWTWDARQHQLDAGLKALLDYVSKYKTSAVPRGTKFDYLGKRIDLGSWCQSIRTKKRKGQLSTDLVHQLERLPDWRWDSRLGRWEEMYELLLQFRYEHNHLNVPMGKSARPYRSKNLAQWINSQRTRYRNEKLSKSRIHLLEQIPGWHWDSYKHEWNESYRRVKALSESDALSNVFGKQTAATSQIRAWIRAQRRKYHLGKLDAESVKLLENLPGWTWTPQDDVWERHKRLILQYVKREGGIHIPRSHIEDGFKLGELIHGYRQRINDGSADSDRAKFLTSLPGWQQDPFEESWERNFAMLQKFSLKYGHSQPTRSNDVVLDSFVQRQRMLHRKGRLSPTKTQRLSELVGWSWNPKADHWEYAFSRMVAFAKSKGGRRPKDNEVFEGFQLGTWVGVQRRIYKSGKMPLDRQRRLQNIAGWTWFPIEDEWQKSFDQLKDFSKKSKNCSPGRKTAADRDLTMWIGVQRATFRAGKMPADRIRKLESLQSWMWDPVLELWNQNYNDLVEFVAKKHRLPVKEREKEKRLSTWVSVQRSRKKKERMPPDQIAMLNQVETWAWTPFEDSWMQSMAALKRFAKQQGHAQVPQRHVEGSIALGVWVNTQRRKYGNRQLSKERIAQLESVPGWSWNPKTDQWEFKFRLLNDFFKQHGHVRVPDQYVLDGVQLGKWVGKQRSKFNRGELSRSQVKGLESLPGWTWNARALERGRTKSVPKGRRNQ